MRPQSWRARSPNASRSADGRRAHAQLALDAADRLTSANVNAVAVDLGVSERHLRRVFREAVGVSPKAFAKLTRFHRALRAAREDASRELGEHRRRSRLLRPSASHRRVPRDRGRDAARVARGAARGSVARVTGCPQIPARRLAEQRNAIRATKANRTVLVRRDTATPQGDTFRELRCFEATGTGSATSQRLDGR